MVNYLTNHGDQLMSNDHEQPGPSTLSSELLVNKKGSFGEDSDDDFHQSPDLPLVKGSMVQSVRRNKKSKSKKYELRW